MAQQSQSGVREVFGSRFTFVAAGIGMAVGTGNLWRFPRVVGEFGGGAFLIALVVANLIWAIPILMSESLMGSRSQRGTVGAFRDFMGRRFAWMGGYMGFITVGILFYYSVVCGWAIRYFVYAITGRFDSGADTAGIWDDFTTTPWQTILFHAIAIGLVGLIVYRGLKRGFEIILKYTIPVLFVILVILAVRAMTLDGAADGMRYLFVPEWSLLGDAEVWLQAFTQMAFSTGAGWGLYLTYSVYMRRREDFALNAATICSGNLLASLLAGVAVMATIFALRTPEFAAEAANSGNSGLAFIYFAELFGEMPGGTWFFAPLFFLALSLAGLSSLIAMAELATRNVEDMGLPRRRAVPWVVGVSFVAGIPSAISVDFLNNQDFVWGVGLLISGLLAAVAMMKFGVERARAELDDSSDIRVGAWWPTLIRLFPVMFVALFGWWIYRTVDVLAPDTWWNPFEPFSLMTLLVQWVALFVVMYALNGFLSRRVEPGPMTPEVGPGAGGGGPPGDQPAGGSGATRRGE
ncbi:NSS family neurotransmitter:Na+ symporter [Haloactinopolyspora alba]|uniref:NSS family neurotransmitter:Na+ symporter n=1 Tax=Haloactinopolyspora alba TaxID=648780 RepID=A0A2P8DPI3_9ACTN|nr:sodium-dependent transporter [Haloactinopolyspora alba]PSK99130.1 NSS family neurotransmitter:Na+ symporter [Haloactinopolyspora alba]